MTRPRLVDITAAAARIAAARRIILTTHARADGDAIACVAALARALRQPGRQVDAVVHEPVPGRYAFLPGVGSFRVWDLPSAGSVLAGADLLVIADTCAARQLEPVADVIRRAGLPRLAIDHHLTRDDIVDEAWVDESAGACAQMVLRLCEAAGWPVDAETACLLFAGLATDTGWFRFSNADAAVYEAAARLVQRGAAPAVLYERLYLSETEPRARLIGAVMSSFELLAEGRLAVIRLPREVFARCGATPDMTEDIINEPARLGAVEACAMFVQPADDGPIRVSLRSKRGVDVAAVAARFGGGGHARAAGARIAGQWDNVIRDVTAAMLAGLPPPAGAAS
jgi:phosphoesterase RecJ-like protein